MRHALGVLGVLAAGVLLAVSAAMNWRFGFSLGKTELDGQIYGAASAAADCLKALVPFFFFAALRNRMWSQAAAAALVGVVVTAYSLTSALGHAALNRLDTTGQRAVEAVAYKDLRADLKRAEEQLGWIPQHRPALTVQSELDSAKTQRAWAFTKGCAEVTGKLGRDFCQKYHGLNAELAAAEQSTALEARIAGIQAKLVDKSAGTVMAEADPQASVLAKLTGLDIDKVQTAMTIFIALLLEVGSCFGMYIAFSQWRLYEAEAPAAPSMEVVRENGTVSKPIAVAIGPALRSQPSANDNPQRPIVPESDVERFYKEKVISQDDSSVTPMQLYDEYCTWCEARRKEPLARTPFFRDFGNLGITKDKISGKQSYIGIALRTETEDQEDKKSTVLVDLAA
jgi:hypothetical protein